MDPQHNQKRGLLGGGSSTTKLLLIAGAALVLIIIVVIVISQLSGNKGNPTGLVALAQTQQEVIRVATDGGKNAKSTGLQNFAVTTAVSVSSDQHQLLAELQKQGTKLKTKDLELGKNAQTDRALAAAQAANTYDTTFTTTMENELDDYQAKLEDAAKIASTPAGISLLKKQTEDATQLRKQLQVLK
jgi:hypothetical protein